MTTTSSLGALRALLVCGTVALQVGCVGAGGSAPAGTGTGNNGAADTTSGSDTATAGSSDTAAGGADTTGTGGDAATAGDGATGSDTTGSDGAVAPVDVLTGDTAIKPDVTLTDGTTALDGKTDATAPDTNFDALGTNDCCVASGSPGCKDPAIVKCVCAKDAYCCNNKWDNVCVGKVNSAGCGKCEVAPTDAGPTDAADVDFTEVKGSQSCCTVSSKPGCADQSVQLCVCAKDKFCCTMAWDDLCVEGVVDNKCGTCAGSSDAGTTDNVGSDTKPDATGGTDSTTVEVSVDSASAGAKGCTSAADQAFLGKLATDAKLASDFTTQVTNCTLGCSAKTTEAEGTACIGKCLVDQKAGVSEACGGCYGLLGFCTFKNCVANPTEAATANCITAPTGATCKACMDKYQCPQKSDNCKVGK